MAKKIQLQDANGNTLHPLTLGECVTMDNGENLDTLMSKSQMFTPTITQDKSMFKVGTGVDVDYSANVKDGAYESLVFKGKSLINLVEKPTSENVGGSKKWNGYGGGNPSKTFITNGIRLTNTQHGSIVLDYFDISLFKPNTKYTLFIDVYHNGEGAAPVLDKIAGTGQYAIPLKNGHNCIVFTTIPDLTGADMGIRFGYAGSTSASCVYEFSNIIIIEGDHSSIDPDYFEGLCDSKMPILRNVGKNLFDGLSYIDGFVASSNDYTVSHDTNVTSILVNVNKNTDYILSAKTNFDRSLVGGSLEPISIGTKTTNLNAERVSNTIKFNSGEYTNIIIYLNSSKIDIEDIQVEEGSVSTTYEPYKSNILRTSEEIVLREVNGVQDTYNALTGEYVQRIGERGYQEEDLTNPNVITDGVKTQYELTEPITTIVKPSTMTPFAYQNGHVIVKSGFEGQSLLPEIEYSVVTGRTGQVTQNTKVLRKQEQQIIGLEELLLTQVVQMEYERTLLQFDYELQMMMLG